MRTRRSAFQMLGDDRTDFRVFRIAEVRRDRRMSRQEAMRAAGVFAALVVQTAQDRELVSHLRQPREQLTNIEAGDVGARRTEQTANFYRRPRLEIERLQMARAAVGPQ